MKIQWTCKNGLCAFVMASILTFAWITVSPAAGETGAQERIASDTQNGLPLVAHVVVALCDNQYQGIVPVSAMLGNGQDPRNNLYWGAQYGVRTFLTGQAGWELVQVEKPSHEEILERAIFHRQILCTGELRDVYIVADAWDGRMIRRAIATFLTMAAGQRVETFTIDAHGDTMRFAAGGDAHLIGYIGHNGLMEYTLDDIPQQRPNAPARSAVVLACASLGFFLEPLESSGALPLLLTTGLMAPEAYTLDAIVQAWFSGATIARTREAAAHAYAKYQRCSLKAALRLFGVDP